MFQMDRKFPLNYHTGSRISQLFRKR